MTTMNVMEEESWLVLRAQAGDREALDALLKRVQAPLFRYIQSLVTETVLTEDVLQEVFLRVFRKLRWLREPELFRPWAYRIATNEAFRQLRRHRLWTGRMAETELLAQVPALPTHTTFAADWAAQLPQMIQTLSPASRAVVGLYYLHELSLEEVALVLEVPIGTVKSRLAYGLSQLRKRMETSG